MRMPALLFSYSSHRKHRTEFIYNNLLLFPSSQSSLQTTDSMQFINMPKNIGFLICLLIMALDVTAGILGIEAEIAQNKVKHLRLWIFECRDPSYKAFKLGLAAAVLLALAHVVGNLLGGCVCFWSRADRETASPNKQLAVASLIFAWIVLASGFSLLMIGTMANSKSRKSCGISHHRFFSIGGILCFIHGLFTVSYYVSAAASDREDKLAAHTGHA